MLLCTQKNCQKFKFRLWFIRFLGISRDTFGHNVIQRTKKKMVIWPKYMSLTLTAIHSVEIDWSFRPNTTATATATYWMVMVSLCVSNDNRVSCIKLDFMFSVWWNEPEPQTSDILVIWDSEFALHICRRMHKMYYYTITCTCLCCSSGIIYAAAVKRNINQPILCFVLKQIYSLCRD